MRRSKDFVEKIRLNIERRYSLNARFKEKVFVRLTDGSKVTWKGDVYVFALTYDTKAAGTSKEEIEKWKLPGPSAKALEAAEKRGRVLRQMMETHQDGSTVIKRQPKLAYAWLTGPKDRQRTHLALQEGSVKSPVDAVKHGTGRVRER